ncbi:MAG TPA: class I SAM-dependent methyltransferase [Acidimicrobiales bacterium]|nr:class I SAM-dependent methyltransferase [Acidimicrobiales bacterium]
MDDAWIEGRATNLARWEESAPLHAISEHYDLEAFKAGRDDIRPFEIDELGPVAHRDLVHLQCHLGTDTLSWARRGARVVGLDFSPTAVAIATQLSLDCGLPAEFVCADVYDACAALGQRCFDVVYTGIGAINWLPDLATWAKVVAGLLRPGGVLYLLEIHPIVMGVQNDGRTIAHDMIDAGYGPTAEVEGTYAVPTARLTNTITFERAYALSEVITAVLDAKLDLELLHEQSYTNAPWPWAVRGDDGFYRLPEGWPKYPLTYSLRARKPLRS